MAPPHTPGGSAINVGITGKTGSGKTTVSALVAMACAARGLRTLAVDTDVSPNLGLSLDLDTVDDARAVPRALVSGRGGGSITPSQVVSGFGMPTPSGVTLLHAMPASDDVGGCICPAHSSARGLLASALDEADVAVLDMEAGLEHLDRPSGTVAHTDILLVVVEPSRKSSVTAERMVAQALANGIGRVALVGNKATVDDLAALSEAAVAFGVTLAGVVPYDDGIVQADRAGAGLTIGDTGPLRTGVDGILAAFL